MWKLCTKIFGGTFITELWLVAMYFQRDVLVPLFNMACFIVQTAILSQKRFQFKFLLVSSNYFLANSWKVLYLGLKTYERWLVKLRSLKIFLSSVCWGFFLPYIATRHSARWARKPHLLRWQKMTLKQYVIIEWEQNGSLLFADMLWIDLLFQE